LKKNADQITKIREYISKFTKYYGSMNEKIEDYVHLFPVHPDYIDTFETLKTVEKREILKSLSREMRKILDKDVPSDEPGFIAFDTYWLSLCEDPSFRTLPDVKAVMDCSTVLESRISLSLPHEQFKPMAIRIIHGLSLFRLTTGDIYSRIGVTAEELRDRLCLYNPVIAQMGSSEPEKELLTNIETVLSEIYSTVSGQFITKNRENNQYYLDLKKNDDYDAKVEQRAATLSPGDIDKCYYRALMQIMECPTPIYRPGFKIWPYDILWYPHKASRSGYLFFGTPNERSTTVPARDFYIYFLDPYNSFSFNDEKKSDEVFFSLANKDEEFENILKLYGGAVMQADTSSGEAKRVYQSIADGYLNQLVKWLQNNIGTAFNITYQGQTQNVSDFLKNRNLRNITGIKDNETINYKDFINAIAEQCLEPYFKDLTPEYPFFTIRLTVENRRQAAQDALRGIANGNPSIQASAILNALELLEDGKISTANSRYARYILGLRQTKTPGQVINRDEIIAGKDGVEYLTEKKYRLEPELVIVVIAALVYTGEVVLSISGGQKFDAGKMTELARSDFQSLIDFKHLEQSKDYNLPALQALFGLFNLPTGKALLITKGNDGSVNSVTDLQNEIEKIIQRIVILQNEVKQSIRFWDFDLLGILNFSSEISSLAYAKTFFESLQSFNSPGKMKNLTLTSGDIDAYKAIPDILNILDNLLIFAQKNSQLIAWIKQAIAALPPSNPWVTKAEDIQKAIKESLLAISPVTNDSIKLFATDTIQKINDLKLEYIKNYTAMHSAVRLNANDEKKKTKLLRDIRFITLEYLTQINILPVRQVQEFKKVLNDLLVCTKLTVDELKNTPVCPHCSYMPQRDGVIGGASEKIEEAEDVLEKMVTDWTTALLGNLNDPWVKKNMELLKNSDRNLLDTFIKSGKLPSPINDDFIIVLKEALSKLDKVTITIDDIRRILQRSGGPVTPGELKDCFSKYIDTLIQGKEATKVRIVVE
jgi:predicted RNA-binding protein